MLLEKVRLLVERDTELTAVYLILGKLFGAILLFPGTPLTLLAGATLGLWWGSIVSVIGNTLGAAAAFCIARFFLRKRVTEIVYIKYPQIKNYESRFFSQGFLTVIFLRLIPLFPFNALNYALGITKVQTKDYLMGTMIGILPGTIAFVYFGNALTMFSPFHIFSSLAAIVGLVYIGKYYEKKYNY